ncbi:MAG: SurA N-terminal domain-containing protein [Candidatus Daviesbacteria bacterium]|nr:SurA N-terminal domain-containing protein [Candidatus Daviesbacteria bacterium]
MPKVKADKKAKVTKKSTQTLAIAREPITNNGFLPSYSSLISQLKNYRSNKRLLLLAIGVGILVLIYLNRGMIVAATVNGQPVSGIELSKRINNQYRQSTLQQIISEKILEQEAQKRGVKVTDEEVNAKFTEMESSYGGKEAFEALLTQQGFTKADFIKGNVYFPLLIEKMYQNEITPSDEEIKTFMEKNKDLPEATEEAKFKETALNALKQEKLAQIFQEKFQELKSQANVKIF